MVNKDDYNPHSSLKTYTKALRHRLTASSWGEPMDVNILTQLLTVNSQHRLVFDRCLRHLIVMVLRLQLFILYTRISEQCQQGIYRHQTPIPVSQRR